VLKENLDGFMSASGADLHQHNFQLLTTDIDVQIASNTLQLQQPQSQSKEGSLSSEPRCIHQFQTAAYRQEFNMFDTSLPFFYGNLWGLTLNVPILSGGQRKTK
jgi:hypothetical protein